MRVVVHMKWAGITPAQYDQMRETVKWEENTAEGGVFHIASFDDKGLRATDIWESVDHLNAFIEKRLMPAVIKAGITTQPEAEFSTLHRVFATALMQK